MVVQASKGMKSWFEWMEKNPDPTAKEGPVLTERRKSGKLIIDLGGAGIPRYKEDWSEGCINKVATEYLVQAAKEEWGAYPVSSADLGVKENAIYNLRQSVAGFLKKWCGIDATTDHTMIGHSTSGSIAIVHLALLNAGDETISIEPSHYPLNEYKGVLMLQGNIVTASSDPNNSWEPNFDELRKKITDRTKMMVITQPTNPTGRIYSERALKQFVDIAGEHDLPILSDEIYQLITYDGLKAKSVASVAKDVPTIVTGSMSKFFMKPGWCTGYAYFHDPAGKMKELERAAFQISGTPGYGGTRIPTPVLVAAARSFADDRGINECMNWVKSLQAKRDFTVKRINEIPGLKMDLPQAALYGLFRVEEIGKANSRWKDDYEFVLDVLNEEGLRLYAGQKFGKSTFGYARTLLYRKKSALEDSWNRLERFMKAKR
jgi:aspartate/methionine/tyrosine aminotransferase